MVKKNQQQQTQISNNVNTKADLGEPKSILNLFIKRGKIQKLYFATKLYSFF